METLTMNCSKDLIIYYNKFIYEWCYETIDNPNNKREIIHHIIDRLSNNKGDEGKEYMYLEGNGWVEVYTMGDNFLKNINTLDDYVLETNFIYEWNGDFHKVVYR